MLPNAQTWTQALAEERATFREHQNALRDQLVRLALREAVPHDLHSDIQAKRQKWEAARFRLEAMAHRQD